MNLNALREIIENHEHLLVERAQSMGLEEQSVRAAALIVDDRETKWGQILTSDIKLMWQPYKRILKCW